MYKQKHWPISKPSTKSTESLDLSYHIRQYLSITNTEPNIVLSNLTKSLSNHTGVVDFITRAWGFYSSGKHQIMSVPSHLISANPLE